MRKKGDILWIMYLLLMEYTLSEDTCERGTCLGQLSFGEFLPRSAFTTKYQISPYQCATECRLRLKRCKSFNYRRSFLSCQLCEEDSGQGGNNLQPKAGSIHSNIDTWKNIPIKHCNTINCSWTKRCDPSKPVGQNACVPTECPFVALKPGMTIEPSNETAVRTKAKRRCMSQHMERGDPITTCLESEAKWSNPDFKCVCTPPPPRPGTINSTIEVEVGQNYTYKCQDGLVAKAGENPKVMCLPDGSWALTNFTCVCKTPPTKSGAIIEMAEVEVGQNYNYQCQDGLFEKGVLNPIITCLENGSWTSTNFQCVKQNWKHDIIYPNNIQKSDVISAKNGIDLLACMKQCEDYGNCLSFFYDNIQCVLSSSFQRGLPKNLSFSDGLVYYTAPSASCDMGYMNVSLGGSYFCIKLHQTPKRFHEAMKVCESEKAKLLVVTTRDEIADLKNIFPQNTDWTLLGISDEIEEGNWVGWNGKVVKPFWNTNEPRGGTKENCVVYAPDPYIGLIDYSCSILCPFVCNKI